ncbi:LLM class flavin-dependent oxidoreductase [Actinotalea sp. K2]|uniref:LLM class flavin-dependent oxidoreductase n=1 Tax=Actinotalea sp. K2 TaxID=2939438 RepID=UPI002016F5D6|nr:LLM class flavin-dependent oxidoreductase [Actinotalea sp. K2]MCL3861789.1 LLM class flavin-dependent oxidoreductase [Actinotalea sp. K2]
MTTSRSTGTLSFGVRFEPDWPPEELPEFARWAEEHGYDELWFSEDLPWSGGIAMAAAALVATTRLRVGLGLLPVVTRNVATLAMEIATLERLAPGRVVVGLGHGVPEWMEQIGAAPTSPSAALEETTVVLRRLLDGEEVTSHGKHVDVEGLRLGLPPAACPEVLIGTTGPRGLATAGRTSDGVVLPEVTTPDAVRWARATMAAAGAAESTVLFAMANLDDDRHVALAQTRTKIQRILDLGIFPRLTEIAGLGADGRGQLSDATLASMTAAGTPDDVERAVTAWADAGATCVVLVAGDEDARSSYARFAAEVLPRLRGPVG